MTTKFVPSGSQTVGPFFSIGLQHMIDAQAERHTASGMIELRGKVIDRDDAPVVDGLLEFWCADRIESFATLEPRGDGLPSGFYRAATDAEGDYRIKAIRPGPAPLGDGTYQAPHFLVLFFARGLLRHLITRVYFPMAQENDTDHVLLQVPVARRHTLIAHADSQENHVFHWDIVLQGADETAFFAW